MKIAVIVTTYNRPDALRAVLDGYLAQRDRDFEVVVADDGSGPDTAAAVDVCRKRADLAISHVWQEDRGFRAGAIRNRALASTKADYVIFSDGDCIPLPGFVAGHRRLAEKGWFVAGSRILAGEGFSGRILQERLPVHAWRIGRWFHAFLKREINRWTPLWTIPVPEQGRKLPARMWRGVMTCNLGAWRGDLLTVNGFDETYEGWGIEDTDLAIRLIRSGIRHKSARFSAPVIHLWHTENDRAALQDKRRRLKELLISSRTLAERGVDRY